MTQEEVTDDDIINGLFDPEYSLEGKICDIIGKPKKTKGGNIVTAFTFKAFE